MDEFIDAKWNRDHGACYSDERLAELYDRPMTVFEVLTRRDGPWADVPAVDRIWVASHRDVMPRAIRLEWLARMVERALGLVESPDQRSVAVIAALRADRVTNDVCAAARAASDASDASDAAWAARAAASAAARDAAWAASADSAAASDAAWAASDAELERQIGDLASLLGKDGE